MTLSIIDRQIADAEKELQTAKAQTAEWNRRIVLAEGAVAALRTLRDELAKPAPDDSADPA